jgi:hypothetical protein
MLNHDGNLGKYLKNIMLLGGHAFAGNSGGGSALLFLINVDTSGVRQRVGDLNRTIFLAAG